MRRITMKPFETQGCYRKTIERWTGRSATSIAKEAPSSRESRGGGERGRGTTRYGQEASGNLEGQIVRGGQFLRKFRPEALGEMSSALMVNEPRVASETHLMNSLSIEISGQRELNEREDSQLLKTLDKDPMYENCKLSTVCNATNELHRRRSTTNTI
uniref:Uncharacterized protein n=1 Tax=Vespula pensylvanica TaxID=30213 RepID=A0A834NS39_VESPE|nr:hypothetical protein H0235_011476 [Vespula pensylvanica]